MLYIDFAAAHAVVRNYVVVCIKRGKRNRIAYNSGLLYFYHQSALDSFLDIISKTDLEVKQVSLTRAYPPDETQAGYWCPYCQSWEYWRMSDGGYKLCPVCGMSDNDFHVKTYNHTWGQKMKSGATKKKNEKIRGKKK